MNKRRTMAALLVPVLVAAGCGSDDDDTSAITAERTGSSSSASSTSTDDDSSVAGSTASSTTAESDESEARQGGSMTYLYTNSPRTFDPAKAREWFGPGVAIYMVLAYDALVRVDPRTGEIIPRIAESLTSNADSSVWTIKLRPGVTFSDGTAYDAEAVVFNWDRMQQPELASPCASTLGGYQYTAADELTIEVSLSAPQVAFPKVMMDCGSKVASPTAIEQFGEAYGSSPETIVGAGPFTVRDWVVDDHVSYERNPEFWDSPRPYLDELQIQSSPDNGVRVDAILAGTAPAGGLTSFGADSARAEESGLTTLYRLSSGGVPMIFNFTREPTDDVRVRRALILATDLNELNDKAADGHLPLMEAYFQEDSVYYDETLTQETNDLEEAQALIDEYLAEKGVDSITIEVLNPPSFDSLDKTQAQMWERLDGVDVSLRDSPGGQFHEAVATGDFVARVSAVACDDPECFYRLFHTESSQNLEGFGSPELDALIDEARGETNVERQKELYAQIVRNLLVEDPIGVFWYHLGTPALFDPEVVAGATLYDASIPDLTTVWLVD